MPVNKLKVHVKNLAKKVDEPSNKNLCNTFGKHQGIHTKTNQAHNFDKLKQKYNNKKSQISKLKKKLKDLNKKYLDVSQKYDELKTLNIEKLIDNDFKKDFNIQLITDQLKNLNKSRPNWSEEVIRFCILWEARSPSGYQYARDLGLLLPCRSTLKKYLGQGACQPGLSPLIVQRLQVEAQNLSPTQLLGSLIIDEMAIKPSLQYDKNRDSLVGQVDMNGLEKNLGLQNKLANHLLCFVFTSVCTYFKIPVSYFFTLNLNGDDLHILTLNVIKNLESTGFKVLRVVTDNLEVNTNMFKKLCGGNIKPKIVHPFDKDRFLFISYDYCHILKNIRNQFISDKKNFQINNNIVTSKYLKKLYDLQKNLIIKPVRYLTKKHIQPSSLEKMNVKRAIQIFSPEITSVLKYLCSTDPEFKNAGETIKFLEIINRWFSLHNVSNTSKHIHTKNPDVMQFYMLSDERLYWLKNDFIKYLQEWRKNCGNPKTNCLTLQTYQAIILTTKSTVACIQFLLKEGVQYVLTRKFSSDDVESFFGAVRQLGGRNDVTNALTAVNAITKIVKTGIVTRVKDSNTISSQTTIIKSNFKTYCTVDIEPDKVQDGCKATLHADLTLLERINWPPPRGVFSATVGIVGGYLVRTIEDNIECVDCQLLLGSPRTIAPSSAIINNLDRGGLRYPKPEFVHVLIILDRLTKEILEKENLKIKVLQALVEFLMPYLTKNSIFTCSVDKTSNSKDHTIALCSLVLKKFLKFYVTNYGNKCTEDYNVQKKNNIKKKPLSRKILKI